MFNDFKLFNIGRIMKELLSVETQMEKYFEKNGL